MISKKSFCAFRKQAKTFGRDVLNWGKENPGILLEILFKVCDTFAETRQETDMPNPQEVISSHGTEFLPEAVSLHRDKIQDFPDISGWLSARNLSKELSVQRMNKLLYEQGYLKGCPGHWEPTGKATGKCVYAADCNQYGGYAHRVWE